MYKYTVLMRRKKDRDRKGNDSMDTEKTRNVICENGTKEIRAKLIICKKKKKKMNVYGEEKL
jgi:hypothetical protein